MPDNQTRSILSSHVNAHVYDEINPVPGSDRRTGAGYCVTDVELPGTLIAAESGYNTVLFEENLIGFLEAQAG